MRSAFFLLFVCFVSLPTLCRAQRSGASADVPSAKARELMADYRFGEAIEVLQKEMATAERRRRPTGQMGAQLQLARRGANMLAGTERVVFIDSTVVARSRFLQLVRLSAGCGRIDEPHRVLDALSELSLGQSAYINDLEDRVIFPVASADGRSRLYFTDNYGQSWSPAQPLPGLATDSLQDYPFMMPDGVTLYYAAQGEKSLGGYDIFVTRYDASSQQYLHPENIGMPFNSPANDYLYAIDEQAQVGWFVTDRNQPADSVCVYRFLPNPTREVYEHTEEAEPAIRRAARIASIAESQAGQADKVAAARERLAAAWRDVSTTALNEFRFVVNDNVVYTSLSQFRQPMAQERAIMWNEKRARLAREQAALDELRTAYHQRPGASLRSRILSAEQSVQSLEAEVKALAKEVRRLELAQ